MFQRWISKVFSCKIWRNGKIYCTHKYLHTYIYNNDIALSNHVGSLVSLFTFRFCCSFLCEIYFHSPNWLRTESWLVERREFRSKHTTALCV